MRNVFLYSLPLTVFAVTGCGPQPGELAAGSDLKRDLTLVTRPTDPAVTSVDRPVASAIELREVRTQPGSSASVQKVVKQRKTVRRPARHLTARVAEPNRPTQAVRPAIVDVAAPNPGARPVAAVPADSRELPPGKTVSVIPASSGPSPSGEPGTDDIPLAGTGWRGTGGSGLGGGSGMGGRGCRGRGTGIPDLGGQPIPRGMMY